VSRFSVPLREIEECFQGVVPSMIASCSAEGVPNVTEISIVHWVDDEHVALSRQFFNKTIRNLQANAHGQVSVIDPQTGRQFEIDLLYERTETEGPLFDKMSARLEAVASQMGMSKVFRLTAADICRVLECTAVPTDRVIVPPPHPPVDLTKVDIISRRITSACSVDDLLTASLDVLAEEFGYDHSFIMFVDETGERLYTVASHGYEESGVGSEVRFGDGILGVAAERRFTVSLANVRSDLTYTRAVRAGYEQSGAAADIAQEIALPGLSDVASQHVVPIEARDHLLGLLCFESSTPGRFSFVDDFVFHLAAREIGLQLTVLRDVPEDAAAATSAPVAASDSPPAQVRYYAEDDSVFIDNEYLIKGVAGRILWRLLQQHSQEQRTDFTNKELRLDPTLELPDIKDNLEARLALLRRRLEDRCPFISLSSTGRGRIHMEVGRQLRLREA
jgi:predicted pyridoxine 5'-phosphate oxidase superfamily flavin-nucleotide-binding protein